MSHVPNLDPLSALAHDAMRRRSVLVAAASWLVGVKTLAAETSVANTDPISAAELKRAAERGTLCSAANVTGTGLRGEYFARGLGQGAPLLVRVDTTIDFDRSLEWPADLAAERPRSARWTGWVRPPLSGRYRFHVDQPDTRVTVAREVVAGDAAKRDSGIELAAGRYYAIVVEATRLDAVAGRLQLAWTAPYGARYVVPRALLFVPMGA